MMPEDDELKKAFSFFNLLPGASIEDVHAQYKRRAMAWHPDRFSKVEQKRDAEEELKLTNHANDVLKEHFRNTHASGGPCSCTASKSFNESANRRKSQAETHAQTVRQQEPEKRMANEEASRDGLAKAAQLAAAEVGVKDENLRRQVAIYMGICWLVLTAINWAATAFHS